ncbi:MAG: acetylxylan esterase [Bacteroidota bacterium]|nr:acetylxylan esterase [Bacteroidota bacterium]
MDWKTEHTLRTYLIQEMQDQYDRRQSRFSDALRSPEALEEYRVECRESYLSLLGRLPARTPLNAVVAGRTPVGDLVLEKIILESRPGHHLTANMYLPAGDGPFPAVLFFCGHEMTSKATFSYIETAILFAVNGIAVMVTDPVSQGERVQFTDSVGRRVLRGSTTEHTLLNAGAILSGSSVAAWELYDNVRALDYLVSRPDIDSARIGCMGNSGGGAQTMFFIGYDERVKAAAPCSFITARVREYELNGTGDGCQQIPCEGREGLEIADYLAIFAPKPLLILAGRYDFVDYRGTVDAYRELEFVYNVLGHPERVSMFTGDDGHGISALKREAALMWFRKWLDADGTPVIMDTPPLPDEKETWCTPSGQVNALFGDEITVQEYNRRMVKELAPERKRFIEESSREAVLDTLRALLSVTFKPGSPVVAELRGSFAAGVAAAGKLILRREGEVPLPCHFYRSAGRNISDTVVVWLPHEGKAPAGGAAGPDPGRYRAVVAADLRGMGETAENARDNDPKYYNSEYHNAVLGMHTGQPLAGQRVRDILMILDFISADDELARLPVKIVASGPAAPPALMAAALDNRIASLSLSGTIRSFSEITDRPVEKEWFSYIIPGILRYFDLADIAGIRPELKINYANR